MRFLRSFIRGRHADASHPRAERLRMGRGVVVGLLCWVLLLVLQLLGAFDGTDRKLFDARYRLRGERRASDRIALVALDDRTIAAFAHRWPLSRDVFALLLDGLEAARPSAIGLDLLFVGPSSDDPRYDALLALVAAEQKNVVLAINFPPDHESARAAPGPRQEERLALQRHGAAVRVDGVQQANRVLLPFHDLLESAPALGHVTVLVDEDGSVRRLPLFVHHDGRLYASLALRLVGIASGYEEPPQARPAASGLRVQWSDGRELHVPLDGDGGTSIDFAGDQAAFRHVFSMIDVLAWIKSEDRARLESAFADRIVLVGATATGEAVADQGSTPFASGTPLVYVHANALDAILGQRFLEHPRIPVFGILALVSALLGWHFVVLPLPIAAGAMAGCTVLLGGLDYALFRLWRWDIPSTMPLALPAFSYAVLASYRYVFLEHRAREKEKDLDAARIIQRRLLPAAPPQVDGLDLFGINIPAREVGGDYFDFLPLSGRLVVGLGDVSGKGVPAALLMSHLQASLHSQARDDMPTHEIASAMDRLLYAATESGRYATFFLASFGPGAAELRFCNAGHTPGLLVHAGHVEQLESTGVPLGLLPGSEYREDARPFDTGDLLVLYSDGITECLHKGEFYGEERLLALVKKLAARSLSSEEFGRALLDDVRRFAHDNLESDDVTLVVARKV